MAESLDDAAFWLPPQFLVDDEDVLVKKSEKSNGGGGLGGGAGFLRFGALEAFGASDLSETESEEEDFAAGVSLRLARTTLDEDKAFAAKESSKAWTLSGSPQSTLCALGCEQSSSRGSPTAVSSRVSSPPPPLQAPASGTLDLLNAAAGEVAKIQTTTAIPTAFESAEEYAKINHMHFLGHGGGGGGPHRNTPVDFHRQFLLDQQREFQIQKHQKQLQYRQIQQQVRYHQCAQNCRTTLGLPSSAWPSLQQAQTRTPQNGSGMRAVFLGNPSAAKRECSGTGVFLPRQPGTQPETRKKPACSTVLLPARVVQALNLNLADMQSNSQPHGQPRHYGRFTSEADVTLRLRNSNNCTNNVVSHQKRNKNVRPHQPQQVNHEIRLPQDWTY